MIRERGERETDRDREREREGGREREKGVGEGETGTEWKKARIKYGTQSRRGRLRESGKKKVRDKDRKERRDRRRDRERPVTSNLLIDFKSPSLAREIGIFFSYV